MKGLWSASALLKATFTFDFAEESDGRRERRGGGGKKKKTDREKFVWGKFKEKNGGD